VISLIRAAVAMEGMGGGVADTCAVTAGDLSMTVETTASTRTAVADGLGLRCSARAYLGGLHGGCWLPIPSLWLYGSSRS
jgi:hypothetical protein